MKIKAKITGYIYCPKCGFIMNTRIDIKKDKYEAQCIVETCPLYDKKFTFKAAEIELTGEKC